MELSNAQKMVLIDFNEYKKFMKYKEEEESTTSDLSRQRREILDDKTLSDGDKILLYNKICQRSRALGADKRKEKYFESDSGVGSSPEKNIIFLEESSPKKEPIEKLKRKLEFTTPNSSDNDGDGEEQKVRTDDESLKRKKNLKRKNLTKFEQKRVSKQRGGGGGGDGIRSWTILN